MRCTYIYICSTCTCCRWMPSVFADSPPTQLFTIDTRHGVARVYGRCVDGARNTIRVTCVKKRGKRSAKQRDAYADVEDYHVRVRAFQTCGSLQLTSVDSPVRVRSTCSMYACM